MQKHHLLCVPAFDAWLVEDLDCIPGGTGIGGEEIAREKSERPRGNERGLGGKTEEPVTQTAGAWGGQRGAEKCVRQTAGEEGKKRKERDWGEGLPPAPEHFPGQEEGECSLPVQRCRPEPR